MAAKKKSVALPTVDKESITKYFKICFDQISKGKAFTEFGLEEEDVGKIILGAHEGKIQRFLEFVGKEMAKGVGDKSKHKKFVKAIKQTDYLDTIRSVVPSDSEDEDEESVAAIEETPPDIVVPTETIESQEDDEAVTTKKTKKRKSINGTPSKSLPKSKTKMTSTEIKKNKTTEMALSERERKEFHDQMKTEFEQGKAKILKDVPLVYQNRFQTIAFTRWQKQPYRPVMIVSPYALSASSSARKMWFDMYEKTRKRRSQMTYLTYWLGTADLDQAFTFQAEKHFVWHDDAVARGLNQLPKSIQNKLDVNGKGLNKLTTTEREIVDGFDSYVNAIKLAPNERKLPCGEAVELHDVLENGSTTFNEKFAEQMNEEEYDDEDEVYESCNELIDEVPPEKKAHSKPAKSEKLSKPTKAIKKPADPSSMDSVHNASVDDEMDFAEDEIDTEGERTDQSESDADDDEEFAVAIVKPNQIKTKKNVKAKISKTSEKQQVPRIKKTKEKVLVKDDEANREETESKETVLVESKTKIERKRKKKGTGNGTDKKSTSQPVTKKKKINQDEQARFSQEQNDFEKCQLKYEGLITRWKDSLAQECLARIDAVFDELSREVEEMSAPFIETCDISSLLKKSKAFFESDAKKEIYSKLRIRLKTHYLTKKASVPEGFELKKMGKSTLSPIGDAGSEKDAIVPGIQVSTNDEHVVLLKTPIVLSPQSAEATVLVDKKHDGQTTKNDRTSFDTESINRGVETKVSSKPAKMARLSLGSMLKTQSSSQQDSATSTVQSFVITGVPSRNKGWLTTAPETNGMLSDTRFLALEFFKEVAACFESEKLKPDYVVRAVERATFIWSQSQKNPEDAYWGKVHNIIAAICGKDENSHSLVHSISNGFFEMPEQIVELSDDDLFKHFNRDGSF